MTIPGKDTDVRSRTIPGSSSPTFRSYTDREQPKDQLDRALVQVVENQPSAIEAHIEKLYRSIQARGEEAFYIKRRLEGDKCWCWDEDTRSSARERCPDCYGTGIVDGYMRYFSLRNADHNGKIWMAAAMSPEELGLQNAGLQVDQTYAYWTLPMPVSDMARRDNRTYDWVVRFRPDGSEIGRYFVTAAAVSYFEENKELHVAFDVKLADSNEPINYVDYAALKTTEGP